MEITKIFSNVEDPEENLYSVLMSEEELSLYSELQNKMFAKTDLVEGITKFPEYVKFVSGGKKLTPYMKSNIKRFVREKRALRLGEDYLKDGINAKIANKELRLAKKAGKSIELGGGFATIG